MKIKKYVIYLLLLQSLVSVGLASAMSDLTLTQIKEKMVAEKNAHFMRLTNNKHLCALVDQVEGKDVLVKLFEKKSGRGDDASIYFERTDDEEAKIRCYKKNFITKKNNTIDWYELKYSSSSSSSEDSFDEVGQNNDNLSNNLNNNNNNTFISDVNNDPSDRVKINKSVSSSTSSSKEDDFLEGDIAIIINDNSVEDDGNLGSGNIDNNPVINGNGTNNNPLKNDNLKRDTAITTNFFSAAKSDLQKTMTLENAHFMRLIKNINFHAFAYQINARFMGLIEKTNLYALARQAAVKKDVAAIEYEIKYPQKNIENEDVNDLENDNINNNNNDVSVINNNNFVTNNAITDHSVVNIPVANNNNNTPINRFASNNIVDNTPSDVKIESAPPTPRDNNNTTASANRRTATNASYAKNNYNKKQVGKLEYMCRWLKKPSFWISSFTVVTVVSGIAYKMYKTKISKKRKKDNIDNVETDDEDNNNLSDQKHDNVDKNDDDSANLSVKN